MRRVAAVLAVAGAASVLVATPAQAHVSVCKGHAHEPLTMMEGTFLYAEGVVNCPPDAHNTGTVVQVSIKKVQPGPDKTMVRSQPVKGGGAGTSTRANASIICMGDDRSKGNFYTVTSYYLTGSFGKTVPKKVKSTVVVGCDTEDE